MTKTLIGCFAFKFRLVVSYLGNVFFFKNTPQLKFHRKIQGIRKSQETRLITKIHKTWSQYYSLSHEKVLIVHQWMMPLTGL